LKSVGGGKVEILKAGFPLSHRPDRPAAAKKKTVLLNKSQAVSDGPKRGHFYRGKNGDISKEA
jgi:hypothetical protein